MLSVIPYSIDSELWRIYALKVANLVIRKAIVDEEWSIVEEAFYQPKENQVAHHVANNTKELLVAIRVLEVQIKTHIILS